MVPLPGENKTLVSLSSKFMMSTTILFIWESPLGEGGAHTGVDKGKRPTLIRNAFNIKMHKVF